jgi:hypothetical protein
VGTKWQKKSNIPSHGITFNSALYGHLYIRQASSLSIQSAKMELLGAPFTQVDCTSALPKSFLKRSAGANYARSIINSLTFGRI